MQKFLILLIGASAFAVFFPSAFEEYRRNAANGSGAEALEPAQAIRPASIEPAAPTGAVVLPAGPDGHFRADARINNRAVPVLVDTGATHIAMNEATATSLGLVLRRDDFRYSSQTANGVAAVAMKRLDSVRIGGVELRDVDVAVMRGDGLTTVLLGMSFLGRLSKVEVSNSRLGRTR